MLEHIASFLVNFISSLGYPGIIITMAIESAMIPLPSEVIMPFSGFLASRGVFSLPLVALSGAAGNLIGSLGAYYLGYWGHEKVVRNFVRRWGKWMLLTEDDLDLAEKLMRKYKDMVVLVSRVLPGVRTVISLPAGFAQLPLGRFIFLTFFGSLIWSYLLAWVGFVLGKNWQAVGPIFHKFDLLLEVVLVLAVAFYIYKKLFASKREV